MTTKPRLSRPATFPAVVRLSYADCYGNNMPLDPGAALPAPGTPPAEWKDYPVATVVRLAPYNPAEATAEQQEQHAVWADNDEDDAPASYWFCALRSDERGCDTPSGHAYVVEVLPGWLCGLDQ